MTNPETMPIQPSPARPCGACGVGSFVPTDVKGRRFSYRDERDVELTESMVLPVCNNCDEIRLSEAMASAMDDVFEREYIARRQMLTTRYLERLVSAKWRQADIERLLGLSTGYVSKVLRHEKTLKTSQFRQLLHFAKHPAVFVHDLAEEYPEFVEMEQALRTRGVLQTA